MGKHNRLFDFTVALCLLCGLTGVLGYNGNLTKPSPYVAYCNYGPQFHEGLFPTLIPTSPVEENCQKFTHCRPSKFRNRTDGYEFKCSDWDPDKKYFDAKTCKCVSTSDHCSENVNYNYNPLCYRNYVPGTPPETCRDFGQAGQYYLQHFPDLDDTSKYWQCAYDNPEGPSIPGETYAHRMNCSEGLVWNSRVCACDYPKDEGNDDIWDFNAHPMNRVICAVPENETKPEESCMDPEGSYYVGLFPSNFSSHLYWECIQRGAELVSYSEQRQCAAGQVFNLDFCGCTQPEQSLLPPAAPKPEDRYKCAELLEDCGEGEPPACHDDDGHYYLGDIPHTSDCSKYYTCDWNHHAGPVPVIPKQRSCQPGLVFNVNSEFCGCDYPENAHCFENHDNKFKCARRIDFEGPSSPPTTPYFWQGEYENYL